MLDGRIRRRHAHSFPPPVRYYPTSLWPLWPSASPACIVQVVFSYCVASIRFSLLLCSPVYWYLILGVRFSPALIFVVHSFAPLSIDLYVKCVQSPKPLDDLCLRSPSQHAFYPST